jgi:MFS family permease
MSPAPRFFQRLGGGLCWGLLVVVLLLSISAVSQGALAATSIPKSPIAKLEGSANSMADNMGGVAFGMAGLGAIGLIIMSLMGRWPWGYFFAYIGSLMFLSILPNFYGSVQEQYKDYRGYEANGARLFQTTEQFGDKVAASLKKVLYGAGAFGAMGVAAVSFLSGRFRWGWMMAILGGFAFTAQLADVVGVMAGDKVGGSNFANPSANASNDLQPMNF